MEEGEQKNEELRKESRRMRNKYEEAKERG